MGERRGRGRALVMIVMLVLCAALPARALAYACADNWVPYVDANFHGPTPGVTRVGVAVRFTAESGDCKWRHAIDVRGLRLEVARSPEGPFIAAALGGQGPIAQWTPTTAGRYFLRVSQGARGPGAAAMPVPRPAQLVVDASDRQAWVAVRLRLATGVVAPSSRRLLLVAPEVPEGWEAPRITVPWPRHARERSVRLPIGAYDVYEGFRLTHLTDSGPIVKTFLLYHARGATPLRIRIEQPGDVIVGD